MKILLAVDGSKNSLDAVKSLIEHADWFSGKPQVFLAYVHMPVPKVGGFGPSKTVLEKYYREEGEAAVAKAVKMLDKAGLDHVDSILVGPVAETLCRHATANKVDMIYMGTRGLSAAANFVVGSVATKVLHFANVPVMLVK